MKSTWICYLLLAGLVLPLCMPLHVGASPRPLGPAADAVEQQLPLSGPASSSRDPVGRAQPDTEFLVAQAGVDYFHPSVAVGGMVVWYARGARGMDIMGLKLLNKGRTPGATEVIADGAGDQEFPFVANDANKGGYLVAWHDLAGKDADVYARYLDQDGRFQGDPFAVVTAKGDQLRPTIAYVPAADGYLVVWQDGRTSAANPDVYARLVPSYATSVPGGGTRGLGKEFAVTTASGGQFIPTAACESGRPRCLVTWQDNRFASTLLTDVVGQLVDAGAASTLDQEIQIAVTTNFQYSPTPAFNPVSAEYMVVWDDDISARRVSLAGVPQGSKLQVSLESPYQYKPTAAVAKDGTYLVVWEDLRNLSTRGADLYGQWLSSAGRPEGRNFALSQDRHNQYSPAVVSGQGWGPEEFFVIWEDDRTAGGTLALYGEWLSPSEGE